MLSNLVIAPIPVNELWNSDLDRSAGTVPNRLLQRRNSCVRGRNVALLHRLQVDDRLALQALFQHLDVLHELDRTAVANVVDAVMRLTRRRVGLITLPPRIPLR